MKKNLLIIALGFSLYGTSQQIGNSNFEAWDNVGQAAEEPTNWNSFKSANCTLGSIPCGIAQTQQVSRSTSVRPGSAGTYSARIYAKSIFGTLANGTITTGRINMGSTTANDPSNHNFTTVGDANFSEVFTSKPDSIVFWANFIPVSGSNNDLARVSAVVHTDMAFKDPNDVATANNLGQADSNFVQTNGWKRFSIPFVWTGNASSAAYILVTFSTNVIPASGTANDELFIDDMELIYNPLTVNELSASKLKAYPNPVQNNVKVEGLNETASYAVYNNQGAVVLSGNINPTQNEINTVQLKSGIYFLTLANQTIKLIKE